MIKVGDYIRFKESFKDAYWYTTEQYMVVKIKSQDKLPDGDYIAYKLDRRYPSHGRSRSVYTFPDRVYLDIAKTREEKIKQVFND